MAMLTLCGCAATGKFARNDVMRWHDAQQMVLVLVPDWDATRGTLRTYARSGDEWNEVGSATPVVIGRSGAAWGLGLNRDHPADGPIKREGDGRSPAGVFAIGQAFGYVERADTRLNYSQMQASDWCVDVSGAALYNRIVDATKAGADAVKGASEHMRLDLFNHGDQRYKLGFVIEHNERQQPMGGSCIFAHLWNGPDSSTTGCTAMSEDSMRRLYRWLEPNKHPVFVLLPEREFQDLRSDWNLPVVKVTP
jgi:L,D-peptidoglycan transpeptidase YkuD (ErfK/YbiS/YcfS/YnhG family)